MTPYHEADGFCPNCDVSLDLHPNGPDPHEPDSWECAVAGQKADLIDRFGRLP